MYSKHVSMPPHDTNAQISTGPVSPDLIGSSSSIYLKMLLSGDWACPLDTIELAYSLLSPFSNHWGLHGAMNLSRKLVFASS
jgi:hypothetical protein